MAIKYHNIFDKGSINVNHLKAKKMLPEKSERMILTKIKQIFFHTTIQLLLTENQK